MTGDKKIMKLISQFTKIFWRVNATFHIRIFDMGDCKAVQWWNDSTSGYFCLELHCKIQLTLHDGLPTNIQSFERDLKLPPVPRRNLDSFRQVNAQLEENIQSAQKLTNDSHSHIQQSKRFIDLTEETSPNKIQRELCLTRTKNKLKAVMSFANIKQQPTNNICDRARV